MDPFKLAQSSRTSQVMWTVQRDHVIIVGGLLEECFWQPAGWKTLFEGWVPAVLELSLRSKSDLTSS